MSVWLHNLLFLSFSLQNLCTFCTICFRQHLCTPTKVQKMGLRRQFCTGPRKKRKKIAPSRLRRREGALGYRFGVRRNHVTGNGCGSVPVTIEYPILAKKLLSCCEQSVNFMGLAGMSRQKPRCFGKPLTCFYTVFNINHSASIMPVTTWVTVVTKSSMVNFFTTSSS